MTTAAMTQRIERSNRAFLDLVWPHLGPIFGGGRLVVAQTEYDTDAGIDFIIQRGMHTHGLAARVQWVDSSFDTFTIRNRTAYGSTHTELRKRHAAHTLDGLRPGYTAQGYITRDGASCLAAAICHTDTLVDVATNGPFTWPQYRNGDTSGFIAVPWAAIGRGHVWVYRGAAS